MGEVGRRIKSFNLIIGVVIMVAGFEGRVGRGLKVLGNRSSWKCFEVLLGVFKVKTKG